MTEAVIDLSPLKTWSHLAKQRRKPSEYEIVSTNLHWHTGSSQPFDVDPEGFMNTWYREYRDKSLVTHPDWDSFRDPDEIVYRSYNMMQDGSETYVDGLLDQFSEEGHDSGLSASWLTTLQELYTPGRYLLHGAQMASGYLVHMAPASTISNCAAFQSADCLRWVSRVAYRTRELAIAHPELGYGETERQMWEQLRAWQGYRELTERALACRDWAESFIAVNVVLKPAIDECYWRAFEVSARRAGDSLCALLTEAALRDSERSRRWTVALTRMMLNEPANVPIIKGWVQKWTPLSDAAIHAYSKSLPDNPGAAESAVERVRAFHQEIGI